MFGVGRWQQPLRIKIISQQLLPSLASHPHEPSQDPLSYSASPATSKTPSDPTSASSFSEAKISPTAPRCLSSLRLPASRPTTPSSFIPAAPSIPMLEPHTNSTEAEISPPLPPSKIRQTRTDRSWQPVTNSFRTTGFQARSLTQSNNPSITKT